MEQKVVAHTTLELKAQLCNTNRLCTLNNSCIEYSSPRTVLQCTDMLASEQYFVQHACSRTAQLQWTYQRCASSTQADFMRLQRRNTCLTTTKVNQATSRKVACPAALFRSSCITSNACSDNLRAPHLSVAISCFAASSSCAMASSPPLSGGCC